MATDFTREITDVRTTTAPVREVTDLASSEEQIHEREDVHPRRAARGGEGAAVRRLDGRAAPSGEPRAAGADTEPVGSGVVDG